MVKKEHRSPPKNCAACKKDWMTRTTKCVAYNRNRNRNSPDYTTGNQEKKPFLGNAGHWFGQITAVLQSVLQSDYPLRGLHHYHLEYSKSSILEYIWGFHHKHLELNIDDPNLTGFRITDHYSYEISLINIEKSD